MEKHIFIVDDDASIRESLSFLFSTLGWTTQSFDSIDAFSTACTPDRMLTGCLLLDMRMPGSSGLTWLEQNSASHPLLPVVMMTGHGSIDACRRAFHHGVFEFFTKPLDADRLIETVHLAFAESETRSHAWQEHIQAKQLFAQLTARETDVLHELITGASNKEVAVRLALSTRTVEAHRAAIFNKLGVSSLVQAIREYDKLHYV
ncbi:response regulator [Scandinavium sp. V105_16]|uniref:Response regulator n=1 Tax=Scandinavium lactucae TaxID=3095028 RepID=A0AAJ2S353_9ENTR|nr:MULTISPECIES: response regulator [unclassified Scandinavium]MDX6020737.1 response regulator [Scandinavium sp. V105_16]MDX6031592.1 response regulator [Scandinavium sp. V105_12]MDX6038892.1 response regulator [Scandinavium sp. V105_6]MDX6049152.1 response regulator [Scandinavium sp. V105_1]